MLYEQLVTNNISYTQTPYDIIALSPTQNTLILLHT